MPKILAYITLPDNKIDQLKSLIKKTHGNPKWMEEHAKRTGINSIDAFFAELPTGTAMIVVRDPAESLENWMKSVNGPKSTLNRTIEISKDIFSPSYPFGPKAIR